MAFGLIAPLLENRYMMTLTSRSIFASLAGSIFLLACAGAPPVATGTAETTSTSTARPASSAAIPRPPRTVIATARQSPPRPPPSFQAAEPPPPDPGSNIFFAPGSDQVSPAGQRQLQIVAEKLKGRPREDITLIGHTDDAGSSEFNIALAQKRVEAVATELQSLGVSPRQIRRISYGNEASGPHTCASARCRQNERRVELRLSAEN